MQHKGKDAWRPAKPRKRQITTALKAYAALTTSAARGAVREIPEGLR
jgi:dihydroxy-acid dehydratase